MKYYILLAIMFIGLVVIAQSKNGVKSNPGDGQHPMIANANTALTTTGSGKVIGYQHKGVFNFKGIPYAKAERFMAPQKPDTWEGIRSCRSYGPVCPINVSSMILNDEMEFAQQHNFAYMNEEKCLNLNVWTNGLSDGKMRPVMVWLHGGGYTAGSSCELPSYDGENLASTGDVVVVSVNHRLNILGFLDLSAVNEKYAESANVGMMDLVAALQWVHANIANFGGDPGNVTIFGQSGGGGKVGNLLYIPSAKGLFQKAIIQSGGNPGFINKELSQQVGLAIMQELGLKNDEFEKLKSIPYEILLAAGNKALATVGAQSKQGGFRFGWGPVLDGKFVPQKPGEEGAENLSLNIPLLIGTTKTEFGMSSRNPQLLFGNREVVKEELRKKYKDNTDSFLAAFDKAYPNTKISSDMIDIDLMFRPASLIFANMKSASPSGAKVYNYLFSWDAPILDGMIKSGHCMEIAFVFNNIARTETYNGGTPEAFELARKLSKTWVSFARTGNPNNEDMPKWDPYTKENGAVMIFDNKSELKFHHDADLLKIASSQQ